MSPSETARGSQGVHVSGREPLAVATTFPGLESVCAQELRALGLEVSRVSRSAVTFGGGRRGLYLAALHCRTALRILRPIARFDAQSPDELYQRVKRLRWERWMSVEQTFAVDAVLSSQHFRHSHYVALKTKDAIVDRFRERCGRRPDVDTKAPQIRARVHLDDRTAQLYLDAAGNSLHRRGYRRKAGEAPLNETVAAALALIAGAKEDQPLVDPFCGSGTILIEAALIARGIAPGLLRKEHALQQWPDFDRELWEDLTAAAESSRRVAQAPLVGGDSDPRVLEFARSNAEAAGVADSITLVQCDARQFEPPPGPGTVVTNPPYGLRLPDPSLGDLYREFGDHLKQAFGGYTAWLLTGDLQLLKAVGLRSSQRVAVFNGNLDCRFARYEIRAPRPPSAHAAPGG